MRRKQVTGDFKPAFICSIQNLVFMKRQPRWTNNRTHRLTHWKLFLAFAFPGFFLSTTRGSLVKNPADHHTTNMSLKHSKHKHKKIKWRNKPDSISYLCFVFHFSLIFIRIWQQRNGCLPTQHGSKLIKPRKIIIMMQPEHVHWI